MKKILIAVVVFFGLGTVGAFAGDLPDLVTVAPQKVFAPPGFDDNDNAQVVLTGEFPSTCFKVAPATYGVSEADHRIVLNNNAYYYSTSWCLFVMVPYMQVVNLGLVPNGIYDVMADDGTGKLRKFTTIPIAKSENPQPDDSLYAVVDDLILSADKREFILRGKLTAECMLLKDVKVLARTANIVEVLPVTELTPGQDCPSKITPFERRVSMEGVNWKGETLFHVRSMNGQALNKVLGL
jgi:hypothetical protein